MEALVNQSDEVMVIREVARPVYDARNWLKLIGISVIVVGAIQLLSLLASSFFLYDSRNLLGYGGYAGLGCTFIFSLAFVALGIYLGILLFRAGNKAGEAMVSGSKSALITSLSNLKIYFIITGVFLLIGIIITVVSICITLIVIPMGINMLNIG